MGEIEVDGDRSKLTRDLLFCELGEVVHLSLVGGTGAVPEEEPLQSFVAFELVRETEYVFFVGEFEEVEQLRACLHDWERRILGVVDKDGDAAWVLRSENAWIVRDWSGYRWGLV